MSYPHPHEVEELEVRFGPRLWDATPGVCCAAFQLGACPHTEAWSEDDLTAEDLAELERRPPVTVREDELVDEPF